MQKRTYGNCRVDGCDKPAYNKGERLCSKHYQRLKAHGDEMFVRGTEYGSAQRYFEEVVLPYDGEDCLYWPFGAGNRYATIARDGEFKGVHWFACKDRNGPPPPGHEVAHICGNGSKGCVAPNHVQWKTHSQNLMDRVAHGTANRGERHGIAKINESDVLEIRRLRQSGLSEQKIANSVGCSRGIVHRVLIGETWSWLR